MVQPLSFKGWGDTSSLTSSKLSRDVVIVRIALGAIATGALAFCSIYLAAAPLAFLTCQFYTQFFRVDPFLETVSARMGKSYDRLPKLKLDGKLLYGFLLGLKWQALDQSAYRISLPDGRRGLIIRGLTDLEHSSLYGNCRRRVIVACMEQLSPSDYLRSKSSYVALISQIFSFTNQNRAGGLIFAHDDQIQGKHYAQRVYLVAAANLNCFLKQ